MADEMGAEEAEQITRAICRLRWERDEAVREVERLRVELERLRSTIDAAIWEASEQWKRLVPPAVVGPGDGTG